VSNPGKFVIGLDLGKLRDYSAVCVLEHLVPERQFRVGHLQRFKLNTAYPQIIEEVAALVYRFPRSELVIDATGVGLAVFDMFVQAGLRPRGVMITGGDQESHEGKIHRVPKATLVSLVDKAMQTQELRILSKLSEAAILRRELEHFEVGYTGTGHMTFNARVGKHDDLVLALAIALWGAVGARKRNPWASILTDDFVRQSRIPGGGYGSGGAGTLPAVFISPIKVPGKIS
jgi:hypothetical protein